MTAVDVLSRLKALHPDRFTDDQWPKTGRS
jgi:hypothetical protein